MVLEHLHDPLGHLLSDASVRQTNWDASKVREELQHDIDSHALSVCNAKLLEITTNFEKQLDKALPKPVESLFEAGGKDTWLSIRKLLKRETEAVVSEFSHSVAGFLVEEETIEKMKQSLRDYARKVVENKAREEAGKVLYRMKDRFATVFSHDNDSKPRVWTKKADIKAIERDALSASLKLLSDMAAIRLDEKSDNIERVLGLLLENKTRAAKTFLDPLASSTWKEVSPEAILISPVDCKSIWNKFHGEIEYIIAQAIAAKKEQKHKNYKWIYAALSIPLAIMGGGAMASS
ncbi:protein root hair defective 3 [Trifolium pratense]|uniref:Protein root hair defective 3 n=1 Tax=Trifolium pratense TaxID=57577 RepID=A0A2K3MUC2_TRIPR|nr:protein root hair defective 3 [Trifolium pratense]